MAEPESVLYEPRGRRELRNVREPVDLFAAVLAGEAGTDGLPCDPVCRTAVDPDRSAVRLVDEETTYFFCSLACAGQFARSRSARAPRTHAAPAPDHDTFPRARNLAGSAG